MEAKRPNIWSLRSFCLITGASRGLGQRMSIRFAERLAAHSVILLAARDSNGLALTKSLVENSRPDIIVRSWSVDLADLTETAVNEKLSSLTSELAVSTEDFEQAILVHNAGSMGDISVLFTSQMNCEELNRYWRVNLTSTIILNSVFWQHFNSCSLRQRIVINISSICAKQAFKSWSIYCSGKAARDIMFRTMAMEEPNILVLNYAPGPIDTSMQLVARTQTADPEIRSMFEAMHAEGRLLSCDQSLDRLISILDSNRFSSGSHIDYYDDE